MFLGQVRNALHGKALHRTWKPKEEANHILCCPRGARGFACTGPRRRRRAAWLRKGQVEGDSRRLQRGPRQRPSPWVAKEQLLLDLAPRGLAETKEGRSASRTKGRRRGLEHTGRRRNFWEREWEQRCRHRQATGRLSPSGQCSSGGAGKRAFALLSHGKRRTATAVLGPEGKAASSSPPQVLLPDWLGQSPRWPSSCHFLRWTRKEDASGLGSTLDLAPREGQVGTEDDVSPRVFPFYGFPGGTHVLEHSSSVSKLFLFPPQPP